MSEPREEFVPIEERRYVIRDRDGDYFVDWRWTGWKGCKRIALWTKDRALARVMTWFDLGVGVQHGALSASEQYAGTLGALTCGYCAVLERIA